MFLIILAFLVGVALYYIRYHYAYWQRRGVFFDPNNKIPYGCLEQVAKYRQSMGMAIHDVYVRSKERFVGIYLLFRPALMVRDVELVHHVLTQDFASFHDRGIYVDEEKDPLSGNLFALKGQSWRTMRTKLAPSFTSGKLKGMFATAEDIGDKMVHHLNTMIPDTGKKEVDIKEIAGTYAIDIIASVIFGLDVNSFENPKNEFISWIREFRVASHFRAFMGMIFFLCPGLAAFFIKLLPKDPTNLKLLKLVRETIEHREKHKIVRRDMLQLLMQLRNTGKINMDDDNWTAQSTAAPLKAISMELITAQCQIFYIAGQETTASTAAFTIFELAQCPELLHKAQQEVKDTLEKNGGRITYEALQQMEFLELCILETIRKYPGLPILNRECTQDYTIPGTNTVIEKGTPIVIPLFGIHRDPDNFPDPEKYDPERFLESNRNYNSRAYMPFGEGPRHCIAQRMGKVNSKLAVFKLLQHFNIERLEAQTVEFEKHTIALTPKGGLKIELSKKAI